MQISTLASYRCAWDTMVLVSAAADRIGKAMQAVLAQPTSDAKPRQAVFAVLRMDSATSDSANAEATDTRTQQLLGAIATLQAASRLIFEAAELVEEGSFQAKTALDGAPLVMMTALRSVGLYDVCVGNLVTDMLRLKPVMYMRAYDVRQLGAAVIDLALHLTELSKPN